MKFKEISYPKLGRNLLFKVILLNKSKQKISHLSWKLLIVIYLSNQVLKLKVHNKSETKRGFKSKANLDDLV